MHQSQLDLSSQKKTKPVKALILLFLANIISGFAQGITMLAIPWYLVHEMGGENGKFLNATMVGAITLLSLFWGIIAGTIIDRYNRKHILMTLTGTGACILLSVSGYGFWYSSVPFILIALVYCSTVFTYNVHYPNLYAFVQELFDPKYYAKVNSALEIQGQTTSFLGMMMAGIFIGGSPDVDWWPESLTITPWSLHKIFLLDGITYIAGFLLVSQIPYVPSDTKRVDKGALWERIRQGFEYLWEHRPLLIFGIASYLMFFSLLVLVQVMMPVYVNDYLQADAFVLASFKGIYSLGAICVGVLGLSMWVKRGHTIKQIIFLLFLGGTVYLIMALTHSVPLALLAASIIGICNAGTRILRITYIVRIVPNHVIGRVNSFFNVLNVLMRFFFIMMMTLPFFSASDQGGNIIYAFIVLSIVLFAGAITLIAYYPSFDHQTALAKS